MKGHLMLKTLKKLILNISMASLLAVPMLATAGVSVYAQDPGAAAATDCTSGSANVYNSVNCGACLDTGTAGTDCNGTTGDASGKVNDLIHLIINIFSLIVGVIAVIMIIVGGLKYITSSGDSNNVSAAKNTILYAIIGLIVVALAQVIVRFVLTKVNPGP